MDEHAIDEHALGKIAIETTIVVARIPGSYSHKIDAPSKSTISCGMDGCSVQGGLRAEKHNSKNTALRL
jgi:hypothetical protein